MGILSRLGGWHTDTMGYSAGWGAGILIQWEYSAGWGAGILIQWEYSAGSGRGSKQQIPAYGSTR
eukprot:363934-Chlamydomonas_euryale.AAC.6